MKKLLLSSFLIVSMSFGALAQGTISFQNFTSATGRVYVSQPPNPNGNPLAPAGYNVALLAGAIGTPIGSLTAVATFTSATANGQFFDGAVITIPGVPAGTGTADTTQNVELAIAGWYGNFASYAAAVAAGAIITTTAEFTNPTGGGGSPAATPANLIGWTSANSLIIVAPEPSTLALFGLGGIVFVLAFRRGKKFKLVGD